ncbi:hypothetical protein [Streptomyces sp. NPDC049887]|uniref:hypothetical protein n=1 Tax=Streptomyces sp. NPDC049887 TaxID=3155654 RepID=UPI00342DA4C5
MTRKQDAERFEALGRMAKVKVGDVSNAVDFWYAGKGSLKNPGTYPVRVRQENGARNVIRIVQVDNGQTLTTVRAASTIWAAPLAQDQGAPQALRRVSKEEIRSSLAADEFATPEDADNARKALWSETPVHEIIVPANVAQAAEATIDDIAEARRAEAIDQTAPAKLPGKPPRNWVELAQSGNTSQARAYWVRACRRYADCNV